MLSGDLFVYCLMALNALAAVTYAWQGAGWKAFYWACVFGLNVCLLKLN